VDVQPVTEIEKSLRLFGTRYLKGVYDDRECNYARTHPQTAAVYLAGRFAAREAVLKLLEAPDVLAIWNDILLGDVVPSPEVLLRDEALNIAKALGISEIFLSLAICRDAVTAIAVADVSSCWKK
jgi:holo-[acyl-carrier protein] synthase